MPAASFNELPHRLRAHWRCKLLLLVGLTVIFSVPYIYFANRPVFQPRDLPLTWLDRAAGFDPRWVWVYQSVYLLTGSLPWLAKTREHLRRYVWGFAYLTTASFLIFILFPVRCPRELIEQPTAMYRLLMLYDGPYNAMPSLHVGFLFYTLCFIWRVRAPLPRITWAVLIGWSLLIAWSTLATKEHYAMDLLVGIAFGWIADLAAWSRMLRISGETSQSG
jgi:membrane-associated phospholipid phosphatase